MRKRSRKKKGKEGYILSPLGYPWTLYSTSLPPFFFPSSFTPLPSIHIPILFGSEVELSLASSLLPKSFRFGFRIRTEPTLGLYPHPLSPREQEKQKNRFNLEPQDVTFSPRNRLCSPVASDTLAPSSPRQGNRKYIDPRTEVHSWNHPRGSPQPDRHRYILPQHSVSIRLRFRLAFRLRLFVEYPVSIPRPISADSSNSRRRLFARSKPCPDFAFPISDSLKRHSPTSGHHGFPKLKPFQEGPPEFPGRRDSAGRSPCTCARRTQR